MTTHVDPITGGITILFGEPGRVVPCQTDLDCAGVNGWCQVTGNLSWPSALPVGDGQCSCYLLGAFTGDDCSTPTPATISYIVGFIIVLAVYFLTFAFVAFMLAVRISKGKAQCDQTLLIFLLVLLTTAAGTVSLAVFVYELSDASAPPSYSSTGVRTPPLQLIKLVGIILAEFFSGWVLMQVAIVWIEFVYKFWGKFDSKLSRNLLLLRLYIVLFLFGFVISSYVLTTRVPYLAQVPMVPGAIVITLVYFAGFMKIRPLLDVHRDKSGTSRLSAATYRVSVMLYAIKHTTFAVALCMITLVISMSLYIAGHGDAQNTPLRQPGTVAAIFLSIAIALSQLFLARYLWLAVVYFDLHPRKAAAGSPGSPETPASPPDSLQVGPSQLASRSGEHTPDGDTVSSGFTEQPDTIKGLGIVNPPDFGASKKRGKKMLSTILSASAQSEA